MRTYDPRYRVAPKRPRPGRFIPQFLAMRAEHDAHRAVVEKVTPLAASRHWTDCDTCLALEVYDRNRPIHQLGYWQNAWLFAWCAVWLAVIVIVAIETFALR